MTAQIDLFRALADPTRLRVMRLLRTMELAVGEIALIVGQSQPRVSRHVRILIEAGLVERRKEASWVFLSICSNDAAAATTACLDAAPMSEEELASAAGDAARLAEVRAERTRAAEDYFATHAEQWDALRSLHAPEADVEAMMAGMLGDAPLGQLVDVGTGTGRIAALLAPRAQNVTGIDRSADMMRLARSKLPPEGAGNVRFIAGDFYDLPLADGTADTATLHQVLHFAQQPEQVIAEIARVVRPGGQVLVVDFAPHEQETLRQNDAHARLGFSDRQIEGWFAAADIALKRTEALDGDALTVKLWLGERMESGDAGRKAR